VLVLYLVRLHLDTVGACVGTEGGGGRRRRELEFGVLFDVCHVYVLYVAMPLR
jgi:hypothetical protein